MRLSSIRVKNQIEIHIQRAGFTYRIFRQVEYSDDKKIAVMPIVQKEDFEFLPTDIVDIIAQKDSKSYKWSKVTPSIFTTRYGVKLHGFASKEDAPPVNRRKTYRVICRQKTNIKYEVTDEAEKNGEGKKPASLFGIERAFSDMRRRERTRECPGFIADLSEGGASVSAPCELTKGDFISFSFPDGRGLVSCRGVVVRSKPTPQNKVYTMNYGIAFTETSSNFVSFLYKLQRANIAQKNQE